MSGDTGNVVELRPCDVCYFADGDGSLRATCKWCVLCQSWICAYCRGRYGARLVAFVLKLKRRLKLKPDAHAPMPTKEAA